MTILTYEEAAKRLNISKTLFRTLVDRSEFLEFQTTAYADLNLNNKGILKISRRQCKGVNYNSDFRRLMKKYTNRKRAKI